MNQVYLKVFEQGTATIKKWQVKNVVKQEAAAIAKWRAINPEIRLDLSHAHLTYANLLNAT